MWVTSSYQKTNLISECSYTATDFLVSKAQFNVRLQSAEKSQSYSGIIL